MVTGRLQLHLLDFFSIVWLKQGHYHMSYYPFLPYSQSPVLTLGMLSVSFGDNIGAHMDEQQKLVVQLLTSFSSDPGYKTLWKNKTYWTTQLVII